MAEDDDNHALLEEYQDTYRIPPRLMQELSQRHALPIWMTTISIARHDDWLRDFHRNVTSGDFPDSVKQAAAGLLEHSNNLGTSVISDAARAILMPICTPAYLRALIRLTFSTMVPPDSSDPNAHMLLSKPKLDEAADQLAFVIGMWQDTGYLDSQDDGMSDNDTISILGSRFLYYHELAHISSDVKKELPNWIVEGEEGIATELVADQYAFTALFGGELRNYSEMHSEAFSAIANAFSLIALKEFAETEYQGGIRITKNATYRMSRLLHWCRIALDDGKISKESLAQGEFIWRLWQQLLKQITEIPSPMFSMLRQTSDRSIEAWRDASNHILRWCAFGDRGKVLSTIRKIRDSAAEHQAAQPKARVVLKLIEFIKHDTNELEPTLGLQACLD